MKLTSTTKAAKQLPARSALNALAKGSKTINDYSKSTPLQIGDTGSTIVQNLRKV